MKSPEEWMQIFLNGQRPHGSDLFYGSMSTIEAIQQDARATGEREGIEKAEQILKDDAKEVKEIQQAAHGEGFAEGREAAANIAMKNKYNESHWRTISGHTTPCHREMSIANEIRALLPKKEVTDERMVAE